MIKVRSELHISKTFFFSESSEQLFRNKIFSEIFGTKFSKK